MVCLVLFIYLFLRHVRGQVNDHFPCSADAPFGTAIESLIPSHFFVRTNESNTNAKALAAVRGSVEHHGVGAVANSSSIFCSCVHQRELGVVGRQCERVVQ